VLQEQSQIMLQQMNTDLDPFLGSNLNVFMAYTPLNQDAIFFMSVVDLTVIGI